MMTDFHRVLKWSVILFALIVLVGCGSAAKLSGKIDADPATVNRALFKVAKKNDWYFERGKGNVVVGGSFGGLPKSPVLIKDANIVVSKHSTGVHNNTGFFGAIRLDSIDNGTATGYTIGLGTPAGDDMADAHLIMELARQQILMDKKEQPSTNNLQKSKAVFLGLDFLTPIASAHYLMTKNPLITPPLRKAVYLQNGLGDAIMVPCLIAAAFVRKNEDRTGLLIGGLSCGFLIRLLCLSNLTDLKDYNELAKLDYNVNTAYERLNEVYRRPPPR
jgi:hypothetical protein